MLNPQLKLPDCYKTQLKLNISTCAPHTHTENLDFGREESWNYFKAALVCAELQHLQTLSLLTVGSKGGF